MEQKILGKWGLGPPKLDPIEGYPEKRYTEGWGKGFLQTKFATKQRNFDLDWVLRYWKIIAFPNRCKLQRVGLVRSPIRLDPPYHFAF